MVLCGAGAAAAGMGAAGGLRRGPPAGAVRVSLRLFKGLDNPQTFRVAALTHITQQRAPPAVGSEVPPQVEAERLTLCCRFYQTVKQINALEASMRALSDAELQVSIQRGSAKYFGAIC